MEAKQIINGKKTPMPWHDPTGTKLLDFYPNCKYPFEKVGWLPFCERFQGHNDKVTLEFSKSLNE